MNVHWIHRGSSGPPISHLRGLRQEDLLSPMLFILVMIILNSLIQRASKENLLLLIAGCQNGPWISFYADNVVLFLRSTTYRLLESCCIVLSKFLVSNYMFKSLVIPIHCLEEDITHTSDIFSCVISCLPCTYLGISLAVPKPSRADLLPSIRLPRSCQDGAPVKYGW
jgi:hypothetical protein